MEIQPKQYVPESPDSIELIMPGMRTSDDLATASQVFCMIRSSEAGDTEVVNGFVEPPAVDASTSVRSPRLVRVAFQQPPCALIADATYAGIVPLETAEQLIEDELLQERWFNEGMPVWSKYDSAADFLEKLAVKVEYAKVEGQLQSSLPRGVSHNRPLPSLIDQAIYDQP